MAVRKHECFLPPPDPGARLWRYLDLAKLTSFLWTRSLHFTPLRDLPDPFEGRLPDHAVPEVDSEFTRTERLVGRDPGDRPGYARAAVDHVRASTYVNCWCCHPYESEALWRLYGHPHGVAITTTFERLSCALSDRFFMGCVKYIDYATQAPPMDNFFNLAMHKRAFFAHEHEVRIVTAVYAIDTTRPGAWRGQAPPFLTEPVPFDAFDGIRTSPYAPEWLTANVAELARRFSCPIPVQASSMR